MKRIKWFIFVFLMTMMTVNTICAAEWKYLYCKDSNSLEFIELEVSKDQKINITAKESIYLMYHVSCNSISIFGPFISCRSSLGSETHLFNSFSRTESGFVSPYSDEIKNETFYFFRFQRNYLDENDKYQNLIREFKFNENDCAWE